jgi:hypothetical protein
MTGGGRPPRKHMRFLKRGVEQLRASPLVDKTVHVFVLKANIVVSPRKSADFDGDKATSDIR